MTNHIYTWGKGLEMNTEIQTHREKSLSLLLLSRLVWTDLDPEAEVSARGVQLRKEIFQFLLLDFFSRNHT